MAEEIMKNSGRVAGVPALLEYIHSFIHSFIVFHRSIMGYRHHWMWNLSIVYTV
jgi:hypothetical protein